MNSTWTDDGGNTGMRIAIRLAGEKDRAHLEQVVLMAARRSGLPLHCCAADDATADMVVLRRGEPGSSALLGDTAEGGDPRPVPVVYTASPREPHPWRLGSPARADDLARIADAVREYIRNRKECIRP